MERNHKAVDETVRYASIVPLVGGFSIGNYMATGVKPAALLSYTAFESNEKHLREYWPDVPYYNLDEEQPLLDRLDFVSTTCPCAGLSMLNYAKDGNKSRGSDAAQNEWMYKSSKYVLESLRPRVFFGENAPGLYGEIGKGVVQRLFDIGQEYGYSLSLMKTSTIKHGIPQERNRTFYFFWDSEYAPVMNYYDRERKNLADYLAEVPADATHQEGINTWKLEDMAMTQFLVNEKGIPWSELMSSGESTLYWYIIKNGLLEEAIQYTEKAKPDSIDLRFMKHIREKINVQKGFWDASPRICADHFSAVISKNMVCGAHPTEERFFTLREYMHLMGMPHDFQLVDPGQWNHIAQNVPTATARDWTLEVMKFLRGELPSSGEKFLKQSNLNPRPVSKSKILF